MERITGGASCKHFDDMIIITLRNSHGLYWLWSSIQLSDPLAMILGLVRLVTLPVSSPGLFSKN